MMEVTQFVQNSPKAKAIRNDLQIKVAEVTGSNIYDAKLVLDFNSEAAGYVQRQEMPAQVGAVFYMTMLTDHQLENSALGRIIKATYQATTFKQIKALEGRTFTNFGEMQ